MKKMKSEMRKKYILEPPFEHFNENLELKPYGYQALFNILADKHLSSTDQGVGVVLANKYAWVLVSMSLVIEKPLTESQQLIGSTWYSGRRGPFFRREYNVVDKNNQTICKGASYSVLLDLENRSIYKQRQLPFEILTEELTHLVEANPTFKQNLEFVDIKEGQIENSHLDGLGHVNNLRYSEFVYDCFSESQIKELKNLKRIELYFHKEMQKSDRFVVKKGLNEKTNTYQIFNLTKKERAFTFNAYFDL
ncbi:MAG: hypothetical protein GX149_02610 [Acholeplasmataceae bacterium]|jgi:acyl-ACP thioesterase|nr:hypothetical protein [Acholeplasmataceae bacterium]